MKMKVLKKFGVVLKTVTVRWVKIQFEFPGS